MRPFSPPRRARPAATPPPSACPRSRTAAAAAAPAPAPRTMGDTEPKGMATEGMPKGPDIPDRSQAQARVQRGLPARLGGGGGGGEVRAGGAARHAACSRRCRKRVWQPPPPSRPPTCTGGAARPAARDGGPARHRRAAQAALGWVHVAGGRGGRARPHDSPPPPMPALLHRQGGGADAGDVPRRGQAAGQGKPSASVGAPPPSPCCPTAPSHPLLAPPRRLCSSRGETRASGALRR